MNVTFNEVKAGSTPLFCKDRNACEESHYLQSLRYCINGDYLCGSSAGDSAAPPANPTSSTSISAGKYAVATISMRGGGAGAGAGVAARARQQASPFSKLGSSLGSALITQPQTGPGGFNNNSRPSSGKKARDPNKVKGINLSTQTMLKIADSDTIMNVLHSLDSTTFNLIVAAAEGSEVNSAASSCVDLEAMKHQMRIHSSSRLYSFIEASDPTVSFLDLSLKLDEPVEEVTSFDRLKFISFKIFL